MLTKIEQNDSVFFTFNYTKTLENLYNIPSSNIIHIHGCVEDNEDFILGHGKSYEDIAKMNSGPDIPSPPNDLTDEEMEQFYEVQADLAEQFHEQLARDAAIAGVASQYPSGTNAAISNVVFSTTFVLRTGPSSERIIPAFTNN